MSELPAPTPDQEPQQPKGPLVHLVIFLPSAPNVFFDSVRVTQYADAIVAVQDGDEKEITFYKERIAGFVTEVVNPDGD